jgi:tetratricopeptide (TPR) repeat protein
LIDEALNFLDKTKDETIDKLTETTFLMKHKARIYYYLNEYQKALDALQNMLEVLQK